VGEGQEKLEISLALLAKQISRKASAYAPLRRKTKRAREKVQHGNDKDKTRHDNDKTNTIIK
jgi:hypothetical protein